MEKSNKRGKIPQSDWPQIMARYEAGETLASIAKTYDCSPPAISYIVSRSRARDANGAAGPAAAEPLLVKAHPQDAPAKTSVETAFLIASPAQSHVPHHPDSAGNGSTPLPVTGNEFAARNGADRSAEHREPGFPGLPRAASRPLSTAPTEAAQPESSDHRPKLHLALGNGSAPNSNGVTSAAQPSSPIDGSGVGLERAGYGLGGLGPNRQSLSEPLRQNGSGDYASRANSSDQPRYGYPQQSRSANGDASGKGGSGAYIDQELRVRVDGDIAAFLSAFDAALARDTQESRSALREATDRLLRAGARTRIELERLEARVPLPPRDSASRAEPAWRMR